MLTFKEFDGINNVLPAKRLKSSELVRAVNVDVGLTKDISRRAGYSEVVGTCHKNLWQAEGFMLATCNGDLTAIWPNATRTVLLESLGVERVWYCNLPDGRTAFSNGLLRGVTDGMTATGWGVPIPERVGTLLDVDGDLHPGGYQYQLAYVRNADNLEGGPAYSNPFAIARGGIHLIGLPVLAGHHIAVYLTSHNGGDAYYAGSTATDEFLFTGKNDELTLPARLDMLYPCPETASISAMYRGRVLVADGPVLYASRPYQFEMFDKMRDFKQFSAPITMIVPVDDGVYVGTESEVAFLAGDTFDQLRYRQVCSGPAVLGSGVSVRGDLIGLGDGRGSGSAVVCIADKVLCAGFNSGQFVRLSEGRYATEATEVAATFRKINGVPQYVAIPQ